MRKYKSKYIPDETGKCIHINPVCLNECLLDSKKRCKNRITLHNSEKKYSRTIAFVCNLESNI